MGAPRIHSEARLAGEDEIELREGAANHVARVLRLGPGDRLVLFDGSGGEHAATILETGKRSVRVRLGAFSGRERESPLDITLAQGISRGERMDYAIQKAVELGVKRIVPVQTHRTQGRLKGERLERKLRHWRGIAISACEQCGRNRVPVIEPPLTLTAWLHGLAPLPARTHRLVLSPTAGKTLPELPPATGATLLIGPEGGLTEEETGLACRQGFTGVRLGPRVLRTETAAVAALSAIQTLWGDFCNRSG